MISIQNSLLLNSALKLKDAQIEYYPQFFNQQQSDDWFNYLLANIEWRQETIQVYGKRHLTPRLSCWMGDADLDYSYSGMTMQPVKWDAQVLTIKSLLEQKLKHSFNSVLLNYYRDGRDSNGWHSDDEPELGKNPVIASVTFGYERDFQLRHKLTNDRYQLKLEHGSVLLMSGTTQQFWQHQIPKRANAESRLNLTFRTIK